jgi:hypothetical protein
MRPREILAANLKQLMRSRPDLDTLPKITALTGISNGALDRWRRAAASARIDELEPLAQAFGLETWELLVHPDQRETLRLLRAAMSSIATKPN